MKKTNSKRIVSFIISFLLGMGISVNADANPKMSAEVSKFGEHTIEITFSEEPVSGVDFSSVALFNTNEKAVEGIDAHVTKCIQDRKALKIEYENELKDGCEYAVVLPEELEGMLGSRYIYFTTRYTPDFMSENTETFDDNYNSVTDFAIADAGGVVPGSGSTVLANGGKDSSAGLLAKTPQTVTDENKTKNEYSVAVKNLNIPTADTVDVQVVEFDIQTPNDTNIPFVFQFKDASGKIISFGRNLSGNILGFYHNSFSWFLSSDTGRISSAALHVDGSPLSFADNEWTHIKLEWDINEKKGKFYVNGKQAAPKTLYNNSDDTNIETGAGAYSNIASVNLYAFPTYSKGSYSQTVTKSGVEMMILDNIRTYGYKKPVTVSKVRFSEMNGRQVGPLDTVSRLLDNVKVYFDGNINEELLSNTNIEVAYGGTPVNCEVSYDSDEKCAIIKPAIIPDSGQDIVVKVSGSSLTIPYQCYATTGDAESVIMADNPAFVKPDGSVINDIGSGDAYMRANIINTTDDTYKVMVSAMGYKDGVLEQYKTKTIEVPAGTIKTIGYGFADTLDALSMTELDGIRASIELMSSDGTSRHPLVKDVFIGTEAESADDVTVSGVVSGAGTTDVIIEVKEKTNDDVIYKTQIVTNEEGAFEKKFNMPGGDDAVSGMYRVFVYAEKYFDSYEILYTNPKKAKDVLDNKLKPAIHHVNLCNQGEMLEKYSDKLPIICGELNRTAINQNAYLHLITNTLSSYYPIKKENDECQSLLEKTIEPMDVFSMLEGNPKRQSYINLAYEYLLKNQPHDSICGCSIDQVHKDMEYRFAQVKEICTALKEDYLFANTREGSEPFGYENINSFKIYDSEGNEIPYKVTEVKRGYRKRIIDRICKAFDLHKVTMQVKIPPCGSAEYKIVPQDGPVRYMQNMKSGTNHAENSFIRLTVLENGTLEIFDKKTGKIYTRLCNIADNGEIGDGWYHAAPVNDSTVYPFSGCSIAKTECGPKRCIFKVSRHMDVPKEMIFSESEKRRSSETVRLNFVMYVGLSENSRSVDIRLEYNNQAKDHRVRLIMPTNIDGETYFAGQAFYCCERKTGINYETQNYRETDQFEKAINGIVGKRDKNGNGIAFVSKAGLHECTAFDDDKATLAITLSRSFKTTVMTNGEARCQINGPLSYEFSLVPLDEDVTYSDLLRLKDEMEYDILSSFVPCGENEKARAPHSHMSVEGKGISTSCIKRAETGNENEIIIRVFNSSAETASGRISFEKEIVAASEVNLNEEHIKDISFNPHEIDIKLAPWKIVTYKIVLKRV